MSFSSLFKGPRASAHRRRQTEAPAVRSASRGLLSLVGFAAIALGGTIAQAATLNVPSQYASIQTAITSANNGDTVVVAPGTYSGDIDFSGKNITVQSSGGAASTIIDCNGSSASPHKGFYIHSGETGAVIQGFTIQNGYDANTGSGVVILASTGTVQQCIIQNCKGRSGGGVYVSAKTTSPFTASNATITGCVIKNCSAFQGGGIFNNASNLAVSQCDFLSNVASLSTSLTSSYGGGIEITKNNTNTVTDTVTDCVFISNTTSADGGAIDMASNNANQTVKVYNCSFYGNASGATNTGTIDFFNGTNTVRNCIFYGDISSKEISTSSPPAANVVQFCDVNQTGYAGVNSNINSDPKYVAPASNNLKLQATSPCIAVGTSTGAPSVDHDGVAWTTNVSMGAFNGVASLPATHFSVSAPSSATAGSPFNVTVTALDSTNSTSTAYSGTVHFTSSDGSATLPADTTLTNGVGTFSVTLTAAGSQTVTATDTVSSSITGTSGAIAVGSGSATRFSMTVPTNATSGSSFIVFVTAKDAYGNTVTGYGGTVHFTSTDGAAVLPADATLINGTGTFSATLNTAGNQTITATDTVTTSITAISGTIAVAPGAATHFAVSAPANATAGTPVSFTVTAQDAAGNTATGYTGTVHFTTTDRYGIIPADSPLTSGTGTFTATLGTVGTQTITATDTTTSSVTGTSSGIVVSHTVTTLLGIRARATTVVDGAPTAINVFAYDTYGNQVTNYSGTIHFTSSDPNAVLPADTTLVNGQGSFSATLYTLGSQSITATDTVTSSINGTQGFTVTDNPATHFRLSASPAAAAAGVPVTVTVVALDAGGNTARGYTGTIHISSNAAGAVLPSNATLTNGTGTFQITFTTVGRYTVTATDLSNSSLTGTSGTVVVSGGAATQFTVTAQSSAVAGKAFGVVVQALDAYGNVATGYTGTVHLTSTDANAVLPADGALYSGQRTFLVTLKTPGSQTVTATDTVNSDITATTGTITAH
jgi:hypothetical protein